MKISLSFPFHFSLILEGLVILLDLSHQPVYPLLALVEPLHLLAITVLVEDELESVVGKWIIGKVGFAIVWPLLWRRKERVHADLEHIFYHCWYNALQMWAA